MAVELQRMTVEAFEQFTELPENAERLFEYIGGEVYEVPSNPYVSMIASRISMFIGMYLLENDIGYVTGEAGGYRVAGERYAPDVAFIAKSKQPELARHGYNPNPPDLAVEVISDASNHEELANLRVKITNYLAEGVVVWVVDPDRRTVEVHQAGRAVQVVGEGGAVSGGDVLPGFQLDVQAVFPQHDQGA